MKNIILTTFIFIALFAKAQQDELIENTWYLQKIIIDESEYITPINEEVNEVTIDFYNSYFSTGVCNGLWGDIQYHSSGQSFTLSNVDVTLMECNLSDNFEFEQLYFSQFFYTDWELAHPFVFSINEVSDFLELTITNLMGVQAIYHTQNTVSLPESNHFNSKLHIYPNPANSQIFIESKTGLKIDELIIYNQLGQKALHLSDINKSIDISTLGQGVYIIELSSGELKARQKLIIE